MSVVKPSAMREVAVDVPKVHLALPLNGTIFFFPSANIETAASVYQKKREKKIRPCLKVIGEMAAVLFGSILQDLGKRYFKSLIPLVRTQERLLAL